MLHLTGKCVSHASSQMHWPDLRGSVRKEGCGAQQPPWASLRRGGPANPRRNQWLLGQAGQHVGLGCWWPPHTAPPAQLPLLLCLPDRAAGLTPPPCSPFPFNTSDVCLAALRVLDASVGSHRQLLPSAVQRGHPHAQVVARCGQRHARDSHCGALWLARKPQRRPHLASLSIQCLSEALA